MPDKKFIYAGPSWAMKSYDSPDTDASPTNLLKLWKLEDSAIDLSEEGAFFSMQYERLINLNSDLPVVYITCEPLVETELFDHMHTEEDVMKYRNNIHKNHTNMLRYIKNPVAIIGAHTDASSNMASNSNNRIIDLSWQNFLRKEINLPSMYNWGADVFHTHWSENGYQLKDKSMIDQMHLQFQSWDALQEEGLMYGPHPTQKGNELYAEYTYDKVQEFLNDNT
jgi:hypothetical protein|tara:strand:- start:823 stop:1494 length:672 start_codon:yes stop_codon:yes gene_type:complete